MKSTDLRRYKTALTNLICHRNPPRLAIRALVREAERIGGDPQAPLAVLTRDHLHDILGAHLSGELDCNELCAWATAVFNRLAYLHTGGKPISAEIGYQSAVYTATKLLAAKEPADLDAAVLARASALLECTDLDPAKEWSQKETAQWEAMMELAHPGMVEHAKQGLAAALLEADIRGIPDPQPIPIMLCRGQPQPSQHQAPPLREGESDLAGFELCGCTWIIRPGPAPDLADLSRVSLGRTTPAALIAHDQGEYRHLVAIAGAEPVPGAVKTALPALLAAARASGLRL
jgi:hypothetical protein